MLKGFKKGLSAVLTIGFSAATGAIAGLGYIVLDGLKCIKDLNGAIKIDVSKLNYTQIEQVIMNHDGTLNIPFSVDLSSQALQDCIPPITRSIAVLGALGVTYVTLDIAYSCYKRRLKQQRKNQENGLLSAVNQAPEASRHEYSY